LLGLCLGLLALGPGLRRGFLLSYDMVFVPRESFSAALPGLAPPRAVPSDLAVAVASRILPADIVQKIVLLAIFALACSGVAALLDEQPVLARLAGGAFYAWNPYVGERLIIGQWALLLGYAGLPWVLNALRAADLARWRGAGRLVLALLPAIIGGFAAMAVTAVLLVPVALMTREPMTRDLRKAVVALAVFAAGCLPWFIPSLLHPVYADPGGVAAFAARADTPFGSVGSLLMLGGMWNADAVPKGYGGSWSAIWLGVVLSALAGFILLKGARGRWPGLGIAAILGLAIGCVGVTAVGRDLLRSFTIAFPAASVMRDAQQFVAPLALALACGFGLVVDWGMHPGQFWRNDLVLGVVAVLAPIVLLPGLAWGAAGRLRPAWYPASWLAAARTIDDSPVRGAALLLPWATERTPAWNHGEVMLDPWSRLISRSLIWNDGTQVGDISMAPDDPRARALDRVIGGQGPLTASLRAAGIRFVVDDADDADRTGQPSTRRLPGAVVILRAPGLTVYQLPG
jgi:hypothetical protein